MAEIASLPLFHQIAGQKVLVLGSGDAADPKRRLVERAGGVVICDMTSAIEQGVRIAFIALDDGNACADAAAQLRDAGMLVNVVDRPDLCDFTTPSILDRNPLLIAVGTGGASAGLAKHIRLRLERILPQTLGKLALALQDLRPRLRAQFPDPASRRQIIDEALRENGVLDPLVEKSAGQALEWAQSLSKDAAATMPVDGANQIADFSVIGKDPEDLTVRQTRLLGEADIVCSHGTIAPEILARARADAVRVVCDLANCPRAKDKAAAPLCSAQQESSAGRKNLTVILRGDKSE